MTHLKKKLSHLHTATMSNLLTWMSWQKYFIALYAFRIISFVAKGRGEVGIKRQQSTFLARFSKMLLANVRAKVAVLFCRLFCPFYNSLLFPNSTERIISKSHGYQYHAFYSWFWLPLYLLASSWKTFFFLPLSEQLFPDGEDSENSAVPIKTWKLM